MVGDALPSDTRLGRYRITGALGRGGMGTVYAGEDQSLRRPVAIKVLHASAGATGRDLERFLLEARAAARLNHPNVVTVHDVGQRGGQAYIVMELVPGGSAQARLRARGAFAWAEATRVILDVCRGLAAAHAAGMIHRDIKPSNILLASDDIAKLADFGLAKAPTLAPTGLTRVGEVFGTPQYMSPEHCTGEPLDERTDLYALGATYYALLVGRPPFDGADPTQVLYAQCSAPVPDPRQSIPDLPAKCAAILTRALAKKRRDRYGSAGEMAADLDALLKRPPAKALPVATPVRLADSRPDPAPPRRRRARLALGLIPLGAALASAYFLWGDPRTPRPNGDAAATAVAPPDRPGTRLALRPRPAPLKGHTGEVRSVSVAGDLITSAGLDRNARVWTADGSQGSGYRLLHTLAHDVALAAVALSADGSLLACGGDASAVFLWDPRSGESVGRLDGPSARVLALAFSPSGKQLAVATEAELLLYDRAEPTFRLASRLLETEYVVSGVAFSRDGKRLAACTYGHRLSSWDAATLARTDAPGRQADWLEAVALSADGGRVIAGDRDGEFFLWQPPQPPRRLGTTPRGATSLAFVPGRDAVVLAGEWAGPLRVCDLTRGGKVEEFSGPAQAITSISFAADGKLLAAGCADTCVYLWDVEAVR